MAINKVEFGDQTLMDLTGDTVTPEDVLNGATFHDRAGVSRSGTASYPVTDVQVNNTSVLDGTVAKVTVPTSTSDLNNDSNFVSDASYVHTDNNYTTTEKNKLSGIASGAEVNVQSDWDQTDSTKDDYIKNKPSIPSAQVNSDWNASSGVAQILNKPTLGTAAAKNYTTSVTSGSSDLVTSGAVYTAIDNLPEPMVFKGSLGTGGTITALPVDGTATIGDTYKVITAGTYAGKAAKIGDTFICLTKTSSANTWELIPSGDEPSGTVTSIATGVGLTGGTITTSGTIKAKLRSETALTNDSAAATETANRIYPVVPDKSGYLAVNVPWTDNNTDTKVTQTADDSTNSDFEVIFSNTADNTTRTEAAKKSSKLKFNPSTGNLQATQLNGVTIGSSPKFTDTNNAVTQTATNTNADYEVLFSATADNTTRTEGARKYSNLKFNPSTGKLTATTLAGNISGDYLSGGYINTHPENSGTIIPFINNDIAYLLKRGGSAVIKYDSTAQTVDISNVFDCSPSYWAINPTGYTTITIELTLHKAFGYTNTIYVDFGSGSWRAKNVKIEVMNSNYEGDTWTKKYENTNNSAGHCYVSTSHTPVGASNSGAGFNKVRFTFSTWNNATIFRIAQLGIINYGSNGLRAGFLPKDGGEMYGDIYPNTTNGANLGTSSKYWNNAYITNINGVAVGSSPKFTDTTYNFSGTIFYSGNKDNAEHNANNAIKNGNYYYTSNGPATSLGASTADGALYVQSHSDSWVSQIAQDYRNGGLYVRGKNNGSWQSWYKVWDSRNLTNLNQLTNGPGYITGITKSMVTTALGYTPPTSDTNNAVTQTATSTSADYEVLFSVTADNTTRTEGARKNSNLKFNPSTGNLQATQLNGVVIGSSPKFTDTDTKNTAGSTDSSSKLFLIGATSQAANPQTYSHDTAYIGTDGCLYSGGTKVLTTHQDISGKVNKSGDTMTGRLTTAKPINQIITGSGTAAQDKGSGVSPRYFPAKWTFNTGQTVTNGDIITIKIPCAGHDYGVFISIDNGTTYKPVSIVGTSRLTTHFGNAAYLTLIYKSDGQTNSVYAAAGADARSNITGGCWLVCNYYDTGNTYDRNRYNAAIKAWGTKIVAGNIIVGINGLYHHLKEGTAFDITYPILYLNGDCNASATTSNTYDILNFTITTTQSITLTAYKPVYIKGTLSGTTFTPVGTTPLTQTVPTSADGKYYMFLGNATSTTAVYLTERHEIYAYKNGAFGQIVNDALSVNGYTVAKSVPSNAVFTDNDTKNTAGSTDSSKKLFLIGAESQAANPQTYSHDTAYVGTDGCLYSNSTKVLTAHQTIKQDGITGATINRFGVCDTAAATAAKVVSITNGTFSLEAGVTIAVRFTNANTATGTPTLNVNSKGAKNIFVNNVQITSDIADRELLRGTVIFVYDGTQWNLIGNYLARWVQQAATSTSADYEVLFSGTADNTTRTEIARKNSNLKFNPNTGNLTVTKVNGEAVFYSGSVSAAVNATTCTISNTNITTSSMIEPFSSNSSGNVIAITKMAVSAGKVVLTFPALTEATSFKVRITNV